ncbi:MULTISPECIES: hypothetical protein [unclassified Pseudomonas]|uniref:hypothetical protein n=1 Tax=unclassified Pseudomonas TaxID=196821 RepID=UPI0014839260|nr:MULTISPECIES: hypothetical protein [unclassified Pseudomonas]
MNRPTPSQDKFPSEEQGTYDPVPTHPEPNSPAHTYRHPKREPAADETEPDKPQTPGA